MEYHLYHKYDRPNDDAETNVTCVSIIAHNRDEMEMVHSYMIENSIVAPYKNTNTVCEVREYKHIRSWFSKEKITGYFESYSSEDSLTDNTVLVPVNIRGYKLNKLFPTLKEVNS